MKNILNTKACNKVEKPPFCEGAIMASYLRLSLKNKWFEMTKMGLKPEDYRGLTPYWYSILCLYNGEKRSRKFWEFAPKSSLDFDTNKVSFKKIDVNVMTGYPSNNDLDRILKYEHKGIEIRTGNPEWGAVKGKLYFVIMQGAVQIHVNNLRPG